MDRWRPVLLLVFAGCICFGAPNARAENKVRSKGPADHAFRIPPSRPTENQPAGPEARRIARPGRKVQPASSGRAAGSREPASMWRSMGSLLLVVGLILLAARFWKKHGPKGTAVLPSEAVEILGRRSLDQRQSIHLVRLGTRILVLGSTPNGLTTLTEVTDPVEVDYLAGLCKSRGEAGGSASQTFRALFQKHGTAEVAPIPAASPSPASKEAEELAERLRLQSNAAPPSGSGLESLHA